MFSRISLSPKGLELSDSFSSFCYCKVMFLSLVPSYHMGLRAKLLCLILSTSWMKRWGQRLSWALDKDLRVSSHRDFLHSLINTKQPVSKQDHSLPGNGGMKKVWLSATPIPGPEKVWLDCFRTQRTNRHWRESKVSLLVPSNISAAWWHHNQRWRDRSRKAITAWANGGGGAWRDRRMGRTSEHANRTMQRAIKKILLLQRLQTS